MNYLHTLSRAAIIIDSVVVFSTTDIAVADWAVVFVALVHRTVVQVPCSVLEQLNRKRP